MGDLGSDVDVAATRGHVITFSGLGVSRHNNFICPRVEQKLPGTSQLYSP